MVQQEYTTETKQKNCGGRFSCTCDLERALSWSQSAREREGRGRRSRAEVLDLCVEMTLCRVRQSSSSLLLYNSHTAKMQLYHGAPGLPPSQTVARNSSPYLLVTAS